MAREQTMNPVPFSFPRPLFFFRVIGSQVALETGRAKKSTLERVSPDEQERVKRRIIEIILDIIRAGQYATPPAAPTGEPIQP